MTTAIVNINKCQANIKPLAMANLLYGLSGMLHETGSHVSVSNLSTITYYSFWLIYDSVVLLVYGHG